MMDWFRRIPALFRSDRRLATLAKGYLFFFILVLICSLWTIQLPAHGTSALESFWISLCASFWEDFAFFTVLGGISIIVSLSQPAGEEFSRRVRYVFNGPQLSEGAHAFLQTKMEELAAFSPNYDLKITLSEHHPGLNAIKATVDSERCLVNTFSERPLWNLLQRYNVHTDQVGDPTQVQGEVVTAKVQGQPDLIQNSIEVRGAKLERDVRINVPANGKIVFNYKFWVWFKVGSSYTFDPQRYTERVKVSIINSFGQPLRLAIHKILDETSPVILLTSGGTCSYDIPELHPGGKALFTLLEVV